MCQYLVVSGKLQVTRLTLAVKGILACPRTVIFSLRSFRSLVRLRLTSTGGHVQFSRYETK